MISAHEADYILEAWVEEIAKRQRGEIDRLRSPSWALSGVSSDCCNATPTIIATKKGRVEVCSTCRQPCNWKLWTAPRGTSARGDGIRFMYINETRVVARDLEDEAHASAVSRLVAARHLIEPRPRDWLRSRWHRTLLGWFALHRYGVTRGVHFATTAGAGHFSRYALYQAQTEGRAIVQQRAARDPWRARAVLGREAA
jgi:hypothetical protein